MNSRNRFKVEQISGDYCDYEESTAVEDAFKLLDPEAYPENQRSIVNEFNRRAEEGNRRYRIAMYKSEMFEKGFNAGMYICTFDRDENMTGFIFTDETRHLLGYDGLDDLPNEFDSWVKTLVPEERDAMVPVFWSTVKSHRELPDISHAEYRMVRKDGKIIWVTGAGRFIRRDDGSLDIYMGCYRDVTAEHEKDRYLRIAEGIGKVFNFSLYIDMATETYQIISTNQYVEKVPKVPNAFRFLRDNVDSSVHPDCKEELKAWIRSDNITELLKEKDTVTKDFYSAEAEKWFRATFMVGDKNADGSLAHIIYGCQDITDAKRIEIRQKAQLEGMIKDLEESEEIIRSAGFGIWAFDLNSEYRICGMTGNEKFREIYGIEDKHITPEECLRYFTDHLVKRTDDPTLIDFSNFSSDCVVRFTFAWDHPKKGLIYVETAGTRHVLSDGTVQISGYASDVTESVLAEQKQKEDLLKLNKSLTEQVDIIGSLASTFASIYYIDMSSMEFFEIGNNSDVIENFIGKNGNAVRGMDIMCSHIVTPEQADEMRIFSDLSTLNERIKGRAWISKQFQAMTGKWDEGIFIAAKRDDQGNCLNVIWAVRDINEQKLRDLAIRKELREARDAAESANKAKSSFLFNMSHDIRTPMNAIVGYTDLIERHYDDKEKCMDYLHKVQQSNEFLLSLINDVLEMARIESGKTRMEETAGPVGAIARETSAIFADQMAKKGITFTSSIDTHTARAFCDQAKVREIYLNILSNALKYTPAGGSVSMQVKELPADQTGRIRIKAVFSDTGIGMSKEFLPHIFEEFSREFTSTQSRQQGTGLGMPIVKKILDLMGGTIEVESELGKGSTFTVILPLKTEGADPVEPKEIRAASVVTDFKGRRILLAEDNDLNAEIATEILKEAGFTVERAEDGAVCVDKLKAAEAGHYDLVLMDIQMPNMNGYEATDAIRQLEDKRKADIKIIAMTANAFEEDKREALRAGMNGHVAKPINVHELLRTLAEMIG